MTLGYTRVTAVDVGVGESCPGNTSRKSTTRGSHGVVGSPPPNAQGGALLPKVPMNPREKLDAATEAEETHGMSVSCITPHDMSNDGNGIHDRRLLPRRDTERPTPTKGFRVFHLYCAP